MRNDPGFMLSASSNDFPGNNKSVFKYDSQRAVAVLKTGVSPSTSPTPSDSPDASKFSSREDPAKYCLLHNKPHPLQKCHAFRQKPIKERKELLKKHGVCYKCCQAIHLARNCEEDVSCTECGSETHVAALHPGPVPGTNSRLAPANGGETAVSTTCTEVWKGHVRTFMYQNMSGEGVPI